MIGKFVRHQPYRFFFIVVESIVAMSASTASSVLFAYAFNDLIKGQFNRFILLAGVFFSLDICSYIFEYLFSVNSQIMIQKYNHDLREKYLQEITLRPAFETNVDRSINALTNDLLLLSQNYLYGFVKMVNAFFRIAFAVIALLTFHWILVIVAGVLATLMLVLPMLFKKPLASTTENISTNNKKFIALLNDWLAGLFELQLNQSAHILWRIMTPQAQALETAYVRQTQVEQAVGGVSNALGSFSQVVLIITASYLSTLGLVPVGLVVSVGDFVFKMFTGLVTLNNNITTHISGKQISEEFQRVLRFSPTQATDHALTPVHFETAITAHQLCVQYPKQRVTIPDFTILPGENVVITGPSGAGKSTLVNLLIGKLTDYQGSLTIDGVEAKTYSAAALARLIGFIPQKTHIFDTTVKNNVTLFDDQLAQSLGSTLQAVNLTGVVQRLEKGAATILDPQQPNLSGGELQRIALARALIRQKAVVIMDEGTSALDPQNTREIIARLIDQAGLTFIMITHSSDDQLISAFEKHITLPAQDN